MFEGLSVGEPDATADREYMSVAVFYFDEVYNLNDREFVQDVSDHYPVYAVFRTDLGDDDQ